MFGRAGDYWDTYRAKITSIAAEQVQRVARKYVVPENLQIVAVGDASKIKPVLDKYGAVEVYGTDGKKKESSCATNQSVKHRIERDTIGEMRAPADALYGAQTQR